MDQYLPQESILSEADGITTSLHDTDAQFLCGVNENEQQVNNQNIEFSTEENDVSFETAADINSLELHHPKTISSEEDAVLLTPKQSPSSNPEISSNQPTTLGLSTSPKSKVLSPGAVRKVFSPEMHRKHLSMFKIRESEKKQALEERRKKQEEEMEKKRIVIMLKHEAADKRLQEKIRASPRKSGAFGSTIRSKSSLSLELNAGKVKSGSTHNLLSPTEDGVVALRPRTAPRLKRPVSMGSLPTSSISAATSLLPPRKSFTPEPLSSKGAVGQPIIKQMKRDETKKNAIKDKVDIKGLMKPTKVPIFNSANKKPADRPSSTTCRPSRTSSFNKLKSDLNTTKPVTAPPAQLSKKPRRSSVGKMESKKPTPAPESPSKSVMNTSTQAKVTQQEEAKMRLEEGRKKAREERARKDEEERRLAEEQRIEEERRKVEAEEARIRLKKEKEMRKKQQEEEAEQARFAEEEFVEKQRAILEERQREDQERLEQQQHEQDQAQLMRRKAEEERMAKEEEERRERQKKLDAILKKSSVKVEAAPKREISANASAILAKHNITLNLPTKLEPSKEALDERKTDEPLDRQDTPESENGENGTCEDSCTSLKSDYVNDNNNSNDTNNNILNDVNQDVLFKLTDDDKSSDDLIRRNAEAAADKDASEFTIGITPSEDLQLSHVL